MHLRFSWIELAYSVFFLISLTITTRWVIKFIGYHLGLHKLKRYLNRSVAVTEEHLLNEIDKLAIRLHIQKPVRLRLVPNTRQLNIIVQETKQEIRIFFLREIMGNGLMGGLAHELSHVVLGHTKFKKRFWPYIIICLLAPLGLVYMYRKSLVPAIDVIIRLLLFTVFLSFWIFDLPMLRRRELQADKLAAETVGKDEVTKFLRNFTRSDINTNIWGEFPFGTHPPISKRIALINNVSKSNLKNGN